MDTSAILKQLVALNEESNTKQPAAREQMLIAAQALVTSLQTPSEFISCIGWAEPARFACVRTALDLKIFDTLHEAGTRGATISELAEVGKADPALVDRMMKHLVATNVVSEIAQGRFANTGLSSHFTEPKFRDGLIYCYDVAGPSFYAMPSFFSETNCKQPLDPTRGPFQYAHKTESHFFPWLNQNPSYLAAFANYMSGYREGKRPWFAPDFYPVRTQLIDGPHLPNTKDLGSSKFLVDVGGGKGHDLAAFATQFPETLGKLVLEDKVEVISAIDPPLPSGIEPVAHDFFTPQPEPYRGARAYFLHSVLHDWDDASCVKILQALKSALVPGYSKVLVHDLIVPNTNAAWSVTSMDFLMMALGSVRERTEADFRRLFAEAGLAVLKIWSYEQGTESIIEAMLPA